MTYLAHTHEARVHSRLPTLVVIGAMKCGTTAVHRYLDAHPRIAMSPGKELDFFSGVRRRDLVWYASRFDAGSELRGESSPGYTSPSFPEAAARMASVIPHVRLLYLVRDPVVRAVSQYWHHRRDGAERRPLGEALLDESSQYVDRSRYFDRLRPFLHHFDPEQIHVVVQERLQADPGRVMDEVYRHVGAGGADGVRLSEPPEGRTESADASPALRSRMWARLADDLERLRDFLNDDVPEWRVPIA
jgi:hypothetical protein